MVELYVPELCKVPGFQPTLPAGMGEELDGAWSGGGGGSGSSKGDGGAGVGARQVSAAKEAA